MLEAKEGGSGALLKLRVLSVTRARGNKVIVKHEDSVNCE